MNSACFCRFLDPVGGIQQGKIAIQSMQQDPRIGHTRSKDVGALTGSGKDSLRSLFPPALRLGRGEKYEQAW